MARADSTIRVNIIGDAKGFAREMDKATGKLGGLGKVVGAIGIGVATDQLLDFGQAALSEADRAGDALDRLRIHLGPLADELDETAGNFAKIGQSRQDMLELEASVADAATALGIANPLIADFADEAAATAAAIALMGDQDAATVLDNINKAAGGATRPLRELGVFIDEAAVAQRAMADTGKTIPDQLTDSELAAARYAIILEQLKPKLDAVSEGSGDVERKQSELQARWETLTGRIGEGLEGPMNDLLAWMLAGVDGLERLDKFLALVEQGWRNQLAPAAAFRDILESILDTLGLIERKSMGGGILPKSAGGGGGTSSTRSIVNAIQDYQERNGQPII